MFENRFRLFLSAANIAKNNQFEQKDNSSHIFNILFCQFDNPGYKISDGNFRGKGNSLDWLMGFVCDLYFGLLKDADKSEDVEVEMDPVIFDVDNSKIKDEVYIFDDLVAPVSDVELVDLQLSMNWLGQ